MKSAGYFLLLEILTFVRSRAQMKTAEVSTPPKVEKMPEALEVRFASSAAPPHLRDNTTI